MLAFSLGSGMPTKKRESAAPTIPVFLDTVFNRRTLILPSGRAVPVIAGRVAAADDELLCFLREHQEFQQAED